MLTDVPVLQPGTYDEGTPCRLVRNCARDELRETPGETKQTKRGKVFFDHKGKKPNPEVVKKNIFWGGGKKTHGKV